MASYVKEELIGLMKSPGIVACLRGFAELCRERALQEKYAGDLWRQALWERHAADLEDAARRMLGEVDAAAACSTALEWFESKGTASFCNGCERHAPKDDQGGATGPVRHAADCPYAALRAAAR